MDNRLFQARDALFEFDNFLGLLLVRFDNCFLQKGRKRDDGVGCS